jgi:hypothetical protein
VLLVFGAPCQLRLLAGQEHGRTIPLADIVDNSHIDMIAFCSKISIGKETYGTTDAGYFVS